MRDDVVNILAGQKDLTHVVVTTFSIDFIFIESVLLRALRKCGHPSLTVLADADEVASTFAAQGRWLAQIGRRYRVVPIRMSPGYRFHPKIVALAGVDRATVLVGSGNLTFGGMRQNDEFWTRFETETDGTGPISAVRDFASRCLDRVPYPGPTKAEISDAFDAERHSWARALDAPSGLLIRVGSGPTLLDQMENALGALEVERIVVGSPYFDEVGDALQAVAGRWPRARVEVLVQAGQCQLTQSSWARIRAPKAAISASTSRGEGAHAFVHAKFYGFFGPREAVVFAGSANCTRAALMSSGTGGNAEALAVVRMSSEEADAAIRAGLVTGDVPPVLPTESPVQPPAEPQPVVRVLGAHYEHGELVVLYQAPERSFLVELLADGRPLRGADIIASDGILKVRSVGVVSRVVVVVDVNGARLSSSEHWVDHEFLLSATSRQRQMAQAISENVAPGQWSFQGWTEVLRLLGDHLAHTPQGATRLAHETKDSERSPGMLERSQFFTDDYRLPVRHRGDAGFDETSRVLGLRNLLLDYFGILNEEEQSSERPIDEEAGDDVVDTQEAVTRRDVAHDRRKKRRDLTDAERRRGIRIAKQIVERCTSPAFVGTRPASMLSSDLAIVAVLLVSGHAEQWLTRESFLDLTYRVWSVLFFDDGVESGGLNLGALSRRHAASASPRQFEEALRSVRLSAALATWCFSCPTGISPAESARFEVATRLAVARCPWLWQLESRDQVERELFEIAQRTGWIGADLGKDWSRVVANWNCLFAEGLALRAFEQSLLQIPLATLRERMTEDDVPAGTLLWQGPKLGFCTLSHPARRSRSDDSAPILTLRSKGRETRLSPPYLLPFRSLLRLVPADPSAHFTTADAETLTKFALRLETVWRGGR